MGRDAHVSTCRTAHRRMAHGGQESAQQRTTSCHILSYHVYSCPFMSHVLEFWNQALRIYIWQSFGTGHH